MNRTLFTSNLYVLLKRTRMDVSTTELLLSSIAVFFAATVFLPKLWRWFSEYCRFSRVLNCLPGPTPVPLVGNMMRFIINPRNQLLNKFEELKDTHGPIFRLWIGSLLGSVHILSWKHAEQIFNSNVHIEKNSTYTFLQTWLGTGLLTSTGAKWHSRRKLLTPAFHRSVLDGFQEIFVDKSDKLIKKLSGKCQESEVFDITPFIWQCSLDIICETAMGTKLNIQDSLSDKDAAYLDSIVSVSELIMERFMKPWLHPKFIYDLTSSGRKFNKCVKIMHEFTKKVIALRKKEYFQLKKSETNQDYDDGIKPKKRKAFIDILIEAAFSEGHENKPILSDEDIREEMDTFMFEGHDTTASGISWTFYLLGRHPEIQEQVYQELKEVFGDEKPTSTQKLTELRLLDRFIKESQRIYPSVPMIGRKIREDVKLGDYLVPAGSDTVIHLYFIHRDPEIFPEPNKFNPDNYLPEACEKRPPYAYVPFSAGSRNCIGQKFAVQEMKTVVANVLQKYRLESVDKPEDMLLLAELILRSEKGIRLKLYPRTI